MAKFRFATVLAILLTTICTIYYLSLDSTSTDKDDGYTAAWTRQDGQMLQGDTGGSKVRYIVSHSASQYDVKTNVHEGERYEGKTRTDFETLLELEVSLGSVS